MSVPGRRRSDDASEEGRASRSGSAVQSRDQDAQPMCRGFKDAPLWSRCRRHRDQRFRPARVARIERPGPHHRTRQPQGHHRDRSVLNWLGHLPNRPDSRAASGYFGGYTNIGDQNSFSLTQVNELHALTGQYPTLLGCDYARGWDSASDPTTLINSSCNSTLTGWWTAGGLVTIDLHLPSPANPGGGGLNSPMGNFADLLTPSTAAGTRWRPQLDKIAQGLQQLENAGVPVLFRADVREVGVQFIAAAGSSGGSAVYVDNVVART
jgi:hypothetical protein